MLSGLIQLCAQCEALVRYILVHFLIYCAGVVVDRLVALSNYHFLVFKLCRILEVLGCGWPPWPHLTPGPSQGSCCLTHTANQPRINFASKQIIVPVKSHNFPNAPWPILDVLPAASDTLWRLFPAGNHYHRIPMWTPTRGKL